MEGTLKKGLNRTIFAAAWACVNQFSVLGTMAGTIYTSLGTIRDDLPLKGTSSLVGSIGQATQQLLPYFLAGAIGRE